MCVCICGHTSRYKNGGRGEENKKEECEDVCLSLLFTAELF